MAQKAGLIGMCCWMKGAAQTTFKISVLHPFRSDWQWGELYAKSMIHDFNNGAEGWTDWNVLLDERGGPNHVQNFCFAPIQIGLAVGRTLCQINDPRFQQWRRRLD